MYFFSLSFAHFLAAQRPSQEQQTGAVVQMEGKAGSRYNVSRWSGLTPPSRPLSVPFESIGKMEKFKNDAKEENQDVNRMKGSCLKM